MLVEVGIILGLSALINDQGKRNSRKSREKQKSATREVDIMNRNLLSTLDYTPTYPINNLSPMFIQPDPLAIVAETNTNGVLSFLMDRDKHVFMSEVTHEVFSGTFNVLASRHDLKEAEITMPFPRSIFLGGGYCRKKITVKFR